MDEKSKVILSVDEEDLLLEPIDNYIASIQQKVNAFAPTALTRSFP